MSSDVRHHVIQTQPSDDMGERESLTWRRDPNLTPTALSQAQVVLELNCWVLGDHYHHVFSVEIARTLKVGDLKDAIKEKTQPVFDHISANTLDLWKVSRCVASESSRLTCSITGGPTSRPGFGGQCGRS